MRRKASRKGSTPKLVSAEPKNTGLSLPGPDGVEIQLAACAQQLHVLLQLRLPLRADELCNPGVVQRNLDRLGLLPCRRRRRRAAAAAAPGRRRRLNSLPEPMGQLTA